jgi:hypothetical protein
VTVSNELAKCKLDVVRVQDVIWKDGGTELARKYNISCGKRMRNKNSVQSFVHNRIISAVKRVQFVSDRMSYTILRGRWCHIIVPNVHAPTEDKTDDVKDSFYEELQFVFDKFPKYHINSLTLFGKGKNCLISGRSL